MHTSPSHSDTFGHLKQFYGTLDQQTISLGSQNATTTIQMDSGRDDGID